MLFRSQFTPRNCCSQSKPKLQYNNNHITVPGVLVDLPGVLVDLRGVLVDLRGVLVDLRGVLVDLPGVLVDLHGVLVDLPGVLVDLRGVFPVLGLIGDIPALSCISSSFKPFL